MRDLPTGTVTFMFTDVEGSTRLLGRLGERYRELQDRHYDLVRTAVAAHGGHEVDTEGDSFFVAFTGAADAVAAAVDVQTAMARAEWPDGATVRLRIGLHTGIGDLGDSGYVGLDVNRAARISAAAHGGQVLVSDPVRALAQQELPPGTHLRDLGMHRLKDFPEPERLHQVVIAGLEQDFPPPATVDARVDNLPTQLDDFVGRTETVTRITDLLGEHRLVTLTGPGGSGKTRLAVEVARRVAATYDDGVCFVDLSSVVNPDQVPVGIVDALGLRQEAGQTARDVLAGHLHGRRLLLVLDNVEQVVDAAPFVTELLGQQPGLAALVTTRVPLHVAGERELFVPPLDVPDPTQPLDPDAVAGCEAVALLLDRASAHTPGFRVTPQNVDAIAQITHRLDGLPLAIELAASWLRTLPPQALLSRLAQRVSTLSSRDPGLPERQRTLRSTIAWSYDLLPHPEQRLLGRLAVFAGTADLAAVEAVGNPGSELGPDVLEPLATLVDHSLVRRADTAAGEPRFGMLETIREYARERLADAGDEALVRRHHAEHFLGVVERAAERASQTDQVEWIRALEPDQQNLRAALRWCLEAGEAELGLRLGISLVDASRLGGRARDVREGVTIFEQLLELPGGKARTLLRAKALTALGDIAWVVDPVLNLRTAEEAVEICRELGDAETLPQAMSQLGWSQLQNGHPADARNTLEEAVRLHLARGDRHKAAVSSIAIGIIAVFASRYDEARATYSGALSTFQELGDSYFAGLTMLLLGGADKAEGLIDSVPRHYQAALSAYLEIGNITGASWALGALAEAFALMGHAEAALRLAGASDALRQGASMPALASAVFGDKLSLARAAVDRARAEEVYREGTRMPLHEAVAYALQPDSW